MTDLDKELTDAEATELFESAFKGNEKEAVEVPEVPEPAKDGEVETPKEGEPTPEQKVEEQQPGPYDWVEKIEDKELKEKAQAALVALSNKAAYHEHKYASDIGRINAYQQQTLALKRQLAELQSRTGARPSPQDPEAPAPQTPEEWEEFLKTDPLAAKSVKALVKQETDALEAKLKGQLEEYTRNSVNPLYEQVQQGYVEKELHALDSIAPGWRELKDTQMFRGWLQHEASPAIQQLAHSNSHQDVLVAFDDFARTMFSTGRAPMPPQPIAPAATVDPSQPNQPATPQVADTSKADQIAAERDKKLKATAVEGSSITPAPRTNQDPTTDEQRQALFEKFFKEGK